MSGHDDRNRKFIEEFRAKGGKMSGQFEATPLLFLTTTGARSGKETTTPVMDLPVGEKLAVFAAKGGAPTNPDWYHNLVAHGPARVEAGDESFEVDAEAAGGEERDRLYREQAELYPAFTQYQENTTRGIPVVVLTRVAS